jgi:hypothetical protein
MIVYYTVYSIFFMFRLQKHQDKSFILHIHIVVGETKNPKSQRSTLQEINSKIFRKVDTANLFDHVK